MKKIGTVKITDHRKIVAQISPFNNQERLDIREWVDSNMSREDPNWIPTKKGLNVPVDAWPAVMKLFKKIRKVVKKTLEE